MHQIIVESDDFRVLVHVLAPCGATQKRWSTL